MSWATSIGALAISLAISNASATTYVRVEKDGSKTYSDRPLPGGQPVELEPAQTYSAPPPSSSSAASSLPREQQLAKEVDSFTYQSCELSPKQDETFTNPQAVSISVSLKPLLRVSDVVDLKLDGATVNSGGALNYRMSPANRGTHTVSVLVKDRFGRQVCSASTQFHVFQPSLNSPARRAQPRPRN